MTSSLPTPDLGPVFVFELGADESGEMGPEFGLPLADLVQVIEPSRISPVPLAPSEILGIMNYRGRILTVVDPAPLVGLSPQRSALTNLVVLRPCQKTMGTLGLQITHARKVVPQDGLRPTAGTGHRCVASIVQVDQRQVQIISTEALLDELIDRVAKRSSI